MLILLVPLVFRVSWHSSTKCAALSCTADNVPDQHDEADFDIPDTQSVLETFMSKLLKQTDNEYQSLSVLLDSLPDPSNSNTAKSMTAAAATEKVRGRTLQLQGRTQYVDRQLALMNFSIEAGILLRGNGVPHAMLDIYVLFARGLPDAFVSQPTQLPHSYTHTRS